MTLTAETVKKQKDSQKHALVAFLTVSFLVVGALVYASSNISKNSNRTYTNTPLSYASREQGQALSNYKSSKPWYKGGTLHSASVAEWKIASHRNKLATAADWLASTAWEGHLTSHSDFDELKHKALKLVKAVDGAVIDVTPDDLGRVIKAYEAAGLIISMSNDLGPY